MEGFLPFISQVDILSQQQKLRKNLQKFSNNSQLPNHEDQLTSNPRQIKKMVKY